MYNYIKGKLIEIIGNNVVIDNNGIGYLISCANPYYYIVDKEYTVYIHEYVREDEHTLYGFTSNEEKAMFLKLIQVKGVGCKTALPFLTVAPNLLISAIENEDITYLKKFPKIGDKVARQIILDLKGKFKNISYTNNVDKSDDLIEVLKSLGYKIGDINKVINKLDNSANLELRLKEALKILMK